MWMVAWDRYALAAQVVEHQMEFKQSLLHKEVVISVACSASAGGRSDLLGVLYDELARSAFWVFRLYLSFSTPVRKKWKDLSGKLGKSFDMASVSLRDEALCCAGGVLLLTLV